VYFGRSFVFVLFDIFIVYKFWWFSICCCQSIGNINFESSYWGYIFTIFTNLLTISFLIYVFFCFKSIITNSSTHKRHYVTIGRLLDNQG
jgi:hypothetical protein